MATVQQENESAITESKTKTHSEEEAVSPGHSQSTGKYPHHLGACLPNVTKRRQFSSFQGR